jgi:hypothetical protein
MNHAAKCAYSHVGRTVGGSDRRWAYVVVVGTAAWAGSSSEGVAGWSSSVAGDHQA